MKAIPSHPNFPTINSMKKSPVLPLGAGILVAALVSSTAHAQNVGIGTTTPQSKLSVNGTTASGGIAVGNTAYTSTPGTIAPTNGAIIQGVTGIGTPTPDLTTSMLTVAAAAGGAGNLRLLPSTNASNKRAGIFWGTNWYQATDTPSNGKNDITFFNILTQTNLLTLQPDNTVGITTTTPAVILDVRGSSTPAIGAGTQATFYYGSTALTPSTATGATSYAATAYFQDRLFCGSSIISFTGTVTASDSRLKNVIGKTDNAQDLETLRKIDIIDYTMKDTVRFGRTPFKKVIAEQVESVYPLAVKPVGFKGLTYTPDICALSSKMEAREDGTAITLDKAHGLKAGDSVRLIDAKNTEMEFDVTKIVDPTTFVIRTDAARKLGEKVFVYGRYCPDLKGVDYEAIAMLNVSATQALAKEVTEQAQQLTAQEGSMKALAAENARLKQEMATMAAAAKDESGKLAARMEALEVLIKGAPSNEVATATVLAAERPQ